MTVAPTSPAHVRARISILIAASGRTLRAIAQQIGATDHWLRRRSQEGPQAVMPTEGDLARIEKVLPGADRVAEEVVYLPGDRDALAEMIRAASPQGCIPFAAAFPRRVRWERLASQGLAIVEDGTIRPAVEAPPPGIAITPAHAPPPIRIDPATLRPEQRARLSPWVYDADWSLPLAEIGRGRGISRERARQIRQRLREMGALPA